MRSGSGILPASATDVLSRAKRTASRQTAELCHESIVFIDFRCLSSVPSPVTAQSRRKGYRECQIVFHRRSADRVFVPIPVTQEKFRKRGQRIFTIFAIELPDSS